MVRSAGLRASVRNDCHEDDEEPSVMTNQGSSGRPGDDFSEVKEQYEEAEGARREYESKRAKLVEMQYRLQAMELQAGAVEEELRSLESFSMTGLLSSLRGDRRERIESARDQLHHLQTQLDAALNAFTSLRAQVSELEKRAEAGDQARAQYEAAFAAKLHQAEVGGGESADRLGIVSAELAELAKQQKLLKQASKAGDEARRGLLEEIETLSTMGRCRVAEGHRAISMVINSALKATYNQCAGRVRQGCRRFATRYAEALGPAGLSDEDGTHEIHETLTRIGNQFDKNWFFSEEEFNSNGYVLMILQNAGLILERKAKDVSEKIALLTDERRKLVEG